MLRINPDSTKETELAKLNNRMPDLQIVSLFLTTQCTGRCRFCHIWGDAGWARRNPRIAGDEIEFETLSTFLKDIRRSGGDISVRLTGGEPTLYSRFADLLKLLRSLHYNIQLLTNGFSLNDNHNLLTEYADFVYVSIDAPEQLHDRTRGRKNLFQDALSGIGSMVKEKILNNLPLPFLSINCVLSALNQDILTDLINQLEERLGRAGGVVTVNPDSSALLDPHTIGVYFEPLLFTTEKNGALYSQIMKDEFGVDVGDTWKGFLIDVTELDAALMEKNLDAIWRKFKIDAKSFIDLNAYFHDMSEVFGHYACRAPWHELRVRPSGDVFLCPDLADYPIGNIHTQTFEEIWRGAKADSFRAFISKGLHGLCNRCCRLFKNYDSAPAVNKWIQTLRRHLSP